MSASKFKYSASPWVLIEHEDMYETGLASRGDDITVIFSGEVASKGFFGDTREDIAGNIALCKQAPVLWELLGAIRTNLEETISLNDEKKAAGVCYSPRAESKLEKFKAFTNVINNIEQEMIDDQERLCKDS